MEPTLILLIALAGLAAGIVSGLFGVGGGILMVPAALYLVPGTDFHAAKAASLVVISVASTVGIWTHYRRRSVDLRVGALLALGGVAGSALAVLAVEQVQEGALRVVFGILLALTGARLAMARDPAPRELAPRARTLLLLGLGFVGGLLAGAFGIGGGILMVPAMVFTGMGVHLAVGTSLVAVLTNSLVGTGTHLAIGYGPQLAALGVPLAVGAVPGVRLGSLWAHKLHAQRLRRAFGTFLALVGILMSLDSAL